jgi:AICAR transformylase/IMP cyclohydrolase PurH
MKSKKKIFVSVEDPKNLDALQGLQKEGWEFVSDMKTAKMLEAVGITSRGMSPRTLEAWMHPKGLIQFDVVLINVKYSSDTNYDVITSGLLSSAVADWETITVLSEPGEYADAVYKITEMDEWSDQKVMEWREHFACRAFWHMTHYHGSFAKIFQLKTTGVAAHI